MLKILSNQRIRCDIAEFADCRYGVFVGTELGSLRDDHSAGIDYFTMVCL